ncbi:MAG: VCBS repeat-containing protein [Planctomycetes bacterium]|nr:VCBS repeat-containing protein [Planctomycetota bacterium]
MSPLPGIAWARPALWTTALVISGGCDREPVSPASGDGGIQSWPLAAAGASQGPLFERLGPDHTGVDFLNSFEWEHPRKHLYQHGYAGGGVCIGDYDADNRPDIYLVSQTGSDRLYRNLGGFRFEDVTDAAGLDRRVRWGTGAVFVDIDNDGDLDLYVCNYDAANLLYVNRGDGTFQEAAARYGLAFRGASVMAGFADYDADGDLDMYLLTNRLYPGPVADQPKTIRAGGRIAIAPGLEEAFAIQRRRVQGRLEQFVIKAGQRDRLYRNEGDGTFTDVSAEAGIAGNHPGLSATWWDYDDDTLPDLYVCNDFWDADRLYHNNGDGTFTDVLEQAVPHTPWFSMGSDLADINNDGRIDFLAADMSATSHYMSKIMMGDMNESRWFLETARPRQYMRNAVYLNTGTGRFMEVAYLANLASTDWTWSVKFGDLDNDGLVDLFVTNGTANHSFDPDLTRRLRELSRDQDGRRLGDPVARWQESWQLYRTKPPRREANRAYRNDGNLRFQEVSSRWGLDHLGISFGAAYGDLDRDGDLDLVVNNIDDPVSIYRNGSVTGHRVLIRLVGAASNRYGIGSTVRLETVSGRQVRYLSPTRGYMSANEPIIHFGLGQDDRITSLLVRWPSGHTQVFENLPADRFYVVTEPSGPPPPSPPVSPVKGAFREVAQECGLTTGSRRERLFNDYRRQPLLPARLSQLGPGLAWGDADGDGYEDLFVGGPAGQAGRLFLSNGDGSFSEAPPGPWADDGQCEDMAPLWLDVDGDGDQDLYVASGSVECEPGDPLLRDRLYLNDGSARFTLAPAGTLPDVADSTGVVIAGDYDRDGDLDLFVGGRVIPGAYPLAPESRLLRNDGGRFVDVTRSVAPGLGRVGLVTAALFSDADGDGRLDLLLTLEWGPVRYFHNRGDTFEDLTEDMGLATRTGWFNSITGADLDGDGDIDYVVMNTGLNTKYHPSPDKPARLFYGDFEGNMRLVEAKTQEVGHLTVRGLSCLSTAMPFVWQKTPSFHQFASASAEEIFSVAGLEQAMVFEVNHLQSGVLINQGPQAGFAYRPLPRLAQASPGYGVVATDLDGDGYTDVYCVQNFFWREPETGHWDGGLSLLMRGDGRGALEPVGPAASGLIVPGDATGLAVCDINDDGRPDLAVAQNNDRLLIFQNQGPGDFLAVRLAGPPGNPTGVGARVTVIATDGSTQTAEVYAGSGYLSQSAPVLYFGRGGGPLREVRVRWPDGTETVHPLDPGTTRLTLRPTADS